MGIDDQAGNFIVFIGNDGFVQELFQRHVGERNPRRDHLRRGLGRDARQAVTGARRRGLGEQIAQIVEDIGGGIDGVSIDHGGSGPSALPCAMTTANTISLKASTQRGASPAHYSPWVAEPLNARPRTSPAGLGAKSAGI